MALTAIVTRSISACEHGIDRDCRMLYLGMRVRPRPRPIACSLLAWAYGIDRTRHMSETAAHHERAALRCRRFQRNSASSVSIGLRRTQMKCVTSAPCAPANVGAACSQNLAKKPLPQLGMAWRFPRPSLDSGSVAPLQALASARSRIPCLSVPCRAPRRTSQGCVQHPLGTVQLPPVR